MVEQISSGTLKTNRPMNARNLLQAMEILKGFHAHFGETEIIFDSVYGYLHESLDRLVDVFLTDGITLEGEIRYRGDYEGRYEYRAGRHAEHEVAKLLCEHSHEKLIAELGRRGYCVSKK